MTRTKLVWISRLALLGLSVLAGILILKNGSEWFAQISQMNWQPDPVLFALSVLLLLTSYLLTPFGWTWIARKLGSASSCGELRAVWFASQLGRYLPGKVWLFIGRAGYLKSKGVNSLNAALAPVFELLHTAASVGVITVATVLLFPEFLHSGILRLAAVIAGTCLLVLPILHPVQKFIYRQREKKLSSAELSPGMKRITFLPPSLSIRVIFLYSALWLMRGVSLFLWLSALGIHNKGMLACIGATPLSWLAGYIVFFVPGGIGVREVATVALIAGPGDTGPLLAAVFGQRLLLAVIEVIMAGISARSIPFLRREAKI